MIGIVASLGNAGFLWQGRRCGTRLSAQQPRAGELFGTRLAPCSRAVGRDAPMTITSRSPARARTNFSHLCVKAREAYRVQRSIWTARPELALSRAASR